MRKYVLPIFISLNVGLGCANAQQIPQNTDPGLILKETIQDNFINKKIKQKENQDEIKKPEAIKHKVPEYYKKASFTLSKANFNESRIFDTNKLERDFVQKYYGKTITLEEAQKICAQITDLYTKKGFITSFAYLPPQTISNGEIEIALFEGKVGKINLPEIKWAKKSYLKNNLLKANNVKENESLNVNAIQKAMQDINEKNYLKGTVTLKKGQEQETTDIYLDVKDKLPVSFDLSWNNTGKELIGNQQAGLTLAHNNLTGYGDKLYASTLFASRTFGLNTGYNVPLGPYGTEFRVGYSLSEIELGGKFTEYNVEGGSRSLITSIYQPIYNNKNTEITSDLTWDMTQAETTMYDYIPLNKYDLRALRLGLNLTKDDFNGRWVSRFETSVGLPIMGATTEVGGLSGRNTATSEFTKLKTDLLRLQILPHKMLGIVKVSGQYSPNKLLGAEQLQLGGATTVRGYSQGLIIGDVGYNVTLELRKQLGMLPEQIFIPYWKEKALKIPLKDRIQAAVFYDHGYAHMKYEAGVDTYKNFLNSVGVGLRCNMSKLLTANFDIGVPLGRKIVYNQDRIRFHFSLTSNLY